MSDRSVWNSRLGFILASAGSAVGLGAIWKFPYMAGTNGGAVFLIPYIIFSLTLGLALLIGEMCLGRATRAGAATAFRRWGGRSCGWIGLVSVLTGFFVLAFYSVVGGWCVHYMIEAFLGRGVTDDPALMRETFGRFAADPVDAVVAHLLFLGATAGVILFGVEKGIERVSKVLMPLLFLMMLVLIVRGLTLPGAWEGVKFLFEPNFEAFTGEALLNALGFSFFSLSVGSGSMMNYGSYLSDETKIGSSTAWIVFLAMAAAILGGLMIMPAVFYVCLFVAAITSSISILEMSAQYLVDEQGFQKKNAIALTTVILAVLGTLSALSFGVLSDVKIFGKTIFDLFDYSTSNIGMPIGVLGIAVVCGWIAWPMTRSQLTGNQHWPAWLLQGLRVVMTIVAPVVILTVMLKGLGLF